MSQPHRWKTKKLPRTLQTALKKRLWDFSGITWMPGNEQYCAYRLDGKHSLGWVRVKQYTNGTVYVEASHPQLLHQVQVLAADIQGLPTPTLPSATLGAPSTSAVSHTTNTQTLPAIGSDESGKGDYFGPLVVAAVYVNDETAPQLEIIGATDSKVLDDQRIAQMAEGIVDIVDVSAIYVASVLPTAYNTRYAQLKSRKKNLNHLLGELHGECIAALAGNNPDCGFAMADQFGAEHYIQDQLNDRHVTLHLHQQHRAESAHIAVAAASVMARARFVQDIKALEDQYDVMLPKGAGAPVLSAGKHLVAQHGREFLEDVAKTHFKTTEQVVP